MPDRASCWPTSCSTTCPFGLRERTGRRLGTRCGSAIDDDALRRGRGPRRAASAGARCAPLGARIPVGARRRDWVRDAIDARRSGRPGRRVRLRVDHRRAGRTGPGPSGCAPTAATSAEGTRSSDLGEQDITCEVAVDQLPAAEPRSDARPTGSAPTASTSWSRRAARSGRSAPPSATSRPSRPAAGSPRPRPSSTRPASAPSASSSGTVADRAHSGNIAAAGLVGVLRVAAGVEGPDRLGQVLGEAEHELVAVLELDRRPRGCSISRLAHSTSLVIASP